VLPQRRGDAEVLHFFTLAGWTTPTAEILPSTWGRQTSASASQHPHQHGPERSILLAVDQELGEGRATLKARAQRLRS
jgi:hypothetical protein